MKRNYNRNRSTDIHSKIRTIEEGRKERESSDKSLHKSSKRFANVFEPRPQPFVSSSFTFYVTCARLFTVRFTLADFPRPLILRGIRDTRSSIEKNGHGRSPLRSLVRRENVAVVVVVVVVVDLARRCGWKRVESVGGTKVARNGPRDNDIPFVMFDLARLAGKQMHPRQ